ncbi:uncharacterized protein [Anoplolepis gracilipes]|uniref:uncharacterized protein isoform X2 n=1 Tax=Anoplolepis gracilipes TaxID=354296 RepID=UPI003B9F8280
MGEARGESGDVYGGCEQRDRGGRAESADRKRYLDSMMRRDYCWCRKRENSRPPRSATWMKTTTKRRKRGGGGTQRRSQRKRRHEVQTEKEKKEET